MATSVSFNGITYSVPATGEQNWGGNTGVDGLLISLANNSFNKAGGLFTLTADADFGATAGLVSIYYKSRSSNIAAAGVVRLAVGDSIGWRNNANSSDLALSIDGSDNLLFDGHIISSSAGVIPVAAGGTGLTSYTIGDTIYASGATTFSKLAIGAANTVCVSTGTAPSWATIVNANVNASAAIVYSKLSLTGGIVNADVNASAAIAYSKLTLTGAVLNADLAGSIAFTKLAALTSANILVGSAGNVATAVAMSGDTTISNAGAVTIAALAVTAAKMSSGAATSGQVATADGSGNVTYANAAATNSSAFVLNTSIAASVAANALTIAIKDSTGADATGGSKVQVAFRNATSTTGTYSIVNLSAALSVVVPDATGLGLTTGATSFLYVYLINNAGTIEAAVSPNLFDEGSVVTTVAVSGGSSLTSMYSTTARSGVAHRLVGRIQIVLAASTHWSNSPTEVSNSPFKPTRQLAYASQTSSASITATSFGAFGSSIAVTFVAVRTGNYRVYSCGPYQITPLNVAGYLRINGSSGSPTVLFSQEGTISYGVSGTDFAQVYIYQLVTLTAGTSYTFRVEGKVDSTGTLSSRPDLTTNGIAIVAEEL